MPKFALFPREDDHAWKRLPKEQRDRIVALYVQWTSDLESRGALRVAEALMDGGRVLRAEGGQVMVAPFDETRQVETAVFVFEAADLDAAVEIARSCPALEHGETVVVRRIDG